MDEEVKRLNSEAKRHSERLQEALDEVSRVIVGQEDILEKLLIGLVAGGHVLLEGVPGLAKTLMVKTLAETLEASFARIQFTPDLLPSDIVGTKIYDYRNSSFTTEKGPVFHNFILADEINRAPPKVQSALLEAMQEHQVSIHGTTFILDRPFMVLATENPIETEGTYKLPEAQVDRFAFKLLIDYPSRAEEKTIIKRNTAGLEINPRKILSRKEITDTQDFNRKIYADDKIEDYVTALVDATRHPDEHGLDLDGMIEYGASPRASIWLILAGKAHAMLKGRGYVLPEDIKGVAHEVLRHRVILSYEAEAEELSSDDVVEKILSKVKSP